MQAVQKKMLNEARQRRAALRPEAQRLLSAMTAQRERLRERLNLRLLAEVEKIYKTLGTDITHDLMTKAVKNDKLDQDEVTRYVGNILTFPKTLLARHIVQVQKQIAKALLEHQAAVIALNYAQEKLVFGRAARGIYEAKEAGVAGGTAPAAKDVFVMFDFSAARNDTLYQKMIRDILGDREYKRVLSQRLWGLTDETGVALRRLIRQASLGEEGISKVVTALKDYLTAEGIGDARTRAVRDAHPGQGVYRSARKNAERLLRSEMAKTQLDVKDSLFAENDLITGYNWTLSNAGKWCDLCIELADNSPYDKDYVIELPHPNCMCDKEPIFRDDIFPSLEEMDELVKKMDDIEENAVEYL